MTSTDAQTVVAHVQPPPVHVMLDLETLGKEPGCAILSIGAVAFSRAGLGSSFYCTIEHPVGRIDSETVLWWLQQSEAARAALFAAPRLNHFDAVARFRDWFRGIGARYLWSHGAGFDEPIFRNAFLSKPPWSYRDVRCARTLYRLAGLSSKDFGDPAAAHDALADATAQALAAVAALNKIGWPAEE